MRTYLILFIVSSLISLLLTPLVRRKARDWGAVAVPDKGRHIHAQPTPRLGGIAIYLAFLPALAIVPLMGNLLSDIFATNFSRIVALLIPATFIFLFGIYDDFRGAGAPLKIFFQAIASIMTYAGGFRIENLSSPFGGYWELPMVLSFPLTALWIICITNAFNLIDGIDGLAAGASVFALLSILVFSIAQGNPEISLLSIALIGAVIGFLRYNFNPATIFLGDSGSLFLGYMAAGLSLAGSQKGSTIVAIAIPLVSFGLPLTEAGLSLVRRFLSGAPLLAGDRGHIHHRLLDRGLTQRQAVILLYGVCGLFSLFGLMLLNPQRNIGALVLFILGAGLIFGVQHLRYPEFSELGNQIRHGVLKRRRAIAANVRVRRASADLENVETPDQFFSALSHMHEADEFDCMLVELEIVSPELEPYLSENRRRWSGLDDRPILWVWEREENTAEEIVRSGKAWSLRVPLTDDEGNLLGRIVFYRDIRQGAPAVDLGHLCGNLPRELGKALSRMTVESIKPA